MSNLSLILESLNSESPIKATKWVPIDLTEKGVREKGISLESLEKASHWFNTNYQADQVFHGGYMEKRNWYGRNPNFVSAENTRNIHLGLDIWAAANTNVHCPIDGKIHSFKHNNAPGDYGYTVILEHTFGNQVMYSLYGHLSAWKFDELEVGMPLPKGAVFAQIGDWDENGNWPPHLHFQLITDLLGNQGDFIGVCFEEEQNKYANLCPDPKLLIPEIK